MAVYVDELQVTAPSQKWPYKKSCHLVADKADELHELASRIGLLRRWFQDHHRQPWLHHYDLTERMRKRAIAAGAVELPAKDWITRHLAATKDTKS